MAEHFVSNSETDKGRVKCLLLYFKRGEEYVCSHNDRRIASQALLLADVAACCDVDRLTWKSAVSSLHVQEPFVEFHEDLSKKPSTVIWMYVTAGRSEPY